MKFIFFYSSLKYVYIKWDIVIAIARRKFFIQKYLIKDIYISYNLYHILLIFSFLRLMDIREMMCK